MDKQYVLKDGNSYFWQWTAIGPACTRDINKARRFRSRTDADMETTKHSGLFTYVPAEVSVDQRDAEKAK